MATSAPVSTRPPLRTFNPTPEALLIPADLFTYHDDGDNVSLAYGPAVKACPSLHALTTRCAPPLPQTFAVRANVKALISRRFAVEQPSDPGTAPKYQTPKAPRRHNLAASQSVKRQSTRSRVDDAAVSEIMETVTDLEQTVGALHSQQQNEFRTLTAAETGALRQEASIREAHRQLLVQTAVGSQQLHHLTRLTAQRHQALQQLLSKRATRRLMELEIAQLRELLGDDAAQVAEGIITEPAQTAKRA